jgi:predicted permease
MAIRVALGASRGRLARQLLTESVLIGLLGGAAGILVAFVGVPALLALAPAGRIPRIDEVQVNGWVLSFTLVISLVTGILFGVVPAQSGARREPHEALGQGTRLVGGPHQRLRAAFVTAEIALALVLLTGAGLMIKSFILMRSLDTGYDARRVVTMAVDLPSIAYPDATRIQAFHTALLERLARIPGVGAVGAVSFRPMGGMGIMGDFQVEGPSPLPHGYSVDKPTVSSGYFNALGIRLFGGRDFTAADRAGAPGVVVISESVARRVWPGREAVGKRISMSDHPGPRDWLTVIGVVADVVQDAQLSRHSTLYLPYLQTTAAFFINHMTFVVRQRPASGSVAPAMRAALRDIDPAVPAQALQTMDQSLRDTIAEPVFQMRLLATFALLALLLAALGTYGVLTYDVTERTREVAVRVALGAARTDVLRLIVGEAARLVVSGGVIGLVGAVALTRLLRTLLFGVAPIDPATFLIAPLVLGIVALLAAAVPARRAAGVDPMVALRSE